MSDLFGDIQTTTTPKDVERPYIEYTLPISAVGLGWQYSQFEEGDLSFRMIELNSREQDQAAKRSGSNQSKLQRELIFAAVWQVGDWKASGNRDKLEAWWEAIGGGGKRMVEAAFVALNSVEEEDVKTFLAAGSRGFGG